MRVQKGFARAGVQHLGLHLRLETEPRVPLLQSLCLFVCLFVAARGAAARESERMRMRKSNGMLEKGRERERAIPRHASKNAIVTQTPQQQRMQRGSTAEYAWNGRTYERF